MDELTIVSEQLPPLDEVGLQWREFDRLGTHGFFATWTWVGTWLRALPYSVKPRLLRAMKGDELVGLATLTLANSKLHGVIPLSQAWLNASGDAGLDQLTIEHNGFSSAHIPADELLQALVKSFDEGQIPADELVLPGIASLVPPQLRLIDAGTLVPGFRAPLDALDASHGIEQLLSSNARQQLRRSLRAAERFGPISVEVAPDLTTALQFFADLKTLHVRWWERRRRRHAFSTPFFEEFHRALIVNAFDNRSIEILRVSAGDRVLGYLYNFRRNGKITSYQSGFPDTFPDLRPGYICHALAMSHYANSGMIYYDFLGGSNQLKRSFGVESYQLGWHRLRRKTIRFQIEAGARKIAGRLRTGRN
jgi:CelD/BcsL family acetyltransferase involved in cellulose biosynthesis